MVTRDEPAFVRYSGQRLVELALGGREQLFGALVVALAASLLGVLDEALGVRLEEPPVGGLGGSRDSNKQ